MSRLRIAAVLVLSAGALVACSGSDDPEPSKPSSSSSSAAAASTGDEIDGDDFTFNAPDGWAENDGSAMPSVNFLALAIDPDDDDGFSDNINVISDPSLTRVDDVDELGDAVEKVLKGVATDVELLDPETVDGEDAAVASATFTQDDVSYKTLQYAVTHDDKGYVVTFSFSEDRPEAERQEVAQSVMASWTWAS